MSKSRPKRKLLGYYHALIQDRKNIKGPIKQEMTKGGEKLAVSQICTLWKKKSKSDFCVTLWEPTKSVWFGFNV